MGRCARLSAEWLYRALLLTVRRVAFWQGTTHQLATGSGRYHVPPPPASEGVMDVEGVLAFVSGLPAADAIGIFGLHANAQLAVDRTQAAGAGWQ